ncbi:ABC transporter ATP-binding protein [Streptococcus halotolerans]|uniref:ABC transporter ATP-binding protein n=1 Tax=Streptococcus halotolerans TaxID=1814128 RepID=UPI0007877EA3|nr:ABC transporter ATP-binding protein [Streptococcus halotolerans]
MTNAICFKNVSFTYDVQSEPTLKGIDLTIEQGEKVLILGPSGSGKSTLGQCLNGIIPGTYSGSISGTLKIAGQEAEKLSIYDRSFLVSTVLQDPDGQFIGLSVAEDVAFALENDGVSQNEMIERVADWAERLDLKNLIHHRPQDLSGGQKQRVSLAGVLIDESPILLFDEPLANLDPKAGQETMQLIDRMHQEVGATTLIIEHRLEDVLAIDIDRIVLMANGEILYNGNPTDLLASRLLAENGIREPLYLTVLKTLGLDVSAYDNLADLQQMPLPPLKLPVVQTEISSQKGAALLEVKQLSTGYVPENPILEDLSFSVSKGELLAVVGKNGTGKSTLAKALCAYLPIKGDLIYEGNSITSDSIKERAERIGYVLQNPNQMISQTMIWDEVALGLRLRGLKEAEITKRVEEVLTVCGLYPYRNWPISALSFGQKKRVTIAAILVLNPQMLILDEPTAGQDQRTYQEIMSFLKELSAVGHTIVMITHDMQLMLDYADRCLVVSDRTIIADDKPQVILSNQDLIEKAHLKRTSLYDLAQKIGQDPETVTAYYQSLKGGA